MYDIQLIEYLLTTCTGTFVCNYAHTVAIVRNIGKFDQLNFDSPNFPSQSLTSVDLQV